MATGANTYGTAVGVAAYVPRYTNSANEFDDAGGSRPPLVRVEAWLDQVSAMVNSALSEYGFVVPVAQPDAVMMLAAFVESHVASIVAGVNGHGRFAQQGQRPLGPDEIFMELFDLVGKWVRSHVKGLSALGATLRSGLDEDDLAGVRSVALYPVSGDTTEVTFLERF